MMNSPYSFNLKLKRPMSKRFFFIFGALALLTAGIFAYIYHIEAKSRLALLMAREESSLLKARQISSFLGLREIASDLLSLSEHEEMRALLAGNERARGDLAHDLLSFLGEKGIYDQIQYLDARGKETIRIDNIHGRSIVTPPNRLRNNARQRYFQKTMTLKKGEVFVSPLGLNMEHHKVETPIKPVIRFATPVFGPNGERRGILAFNYLAKPFLSALRFMATATVRGKFFLLNSDGYYLLAPDPGDEWGFMFASKRDRTFSRVYPAAWKHISNRETGQAQTANGLFTFSTLYPLDFSTAWEKAEPGASRRLFRVHDPRAFRWEILSRIPPELLGEMTGRLQKRFMRGYLLILALLGIFFWVACRLDLLRLREREERARAESQYSDLYENAPDMFYSVEVETGNILQCNETMSRLTGFSKNEIIGHPVFERYAPKHREELKEKWFPQFQKAGEIRNARLKLRKKDGRTIDVLLNATGFYDKEGRLLHCRSVCRDITELRQSEQAALDKATLIDAMLRSAVDLSIVATDPDFRITYFNPAAEKETGYTADQVIGRTAQEMHTNIEPEGLERLIREVHETGEYLYTLEREEKDGTHYIEARVSGIWNEEGQLTGFLRMARDVTERKKAEEAIRHNLEIERALEKSSRLFFAAEGPDLNTFLEYLGKTVKAHRATIFRLRQNGSRLDNTHEWCAEKVAPLIKDLQNMDASPRAWTLEKLRRGENIVINDTNELPAEASAHKRILLDQKIAALLVVPVMGRNKELLGFMGFDDTEKKRMWSDADLRILRIAAEMLASYCERRRAERQLRQSEKKFRSVAQTAIHAIIAADDAGNIISWNHGAKAIFRYREDEALGRPLTILMPDHFRNRHQYGFKRFMKTREPRIMGKTIELEGLRKNGETFPMELSLSSWEIAGKTFCGSIIRDITEQVRAKKSLRQSNERYRVSLEGTIRAIHGMIEARDPYTAGHEQRVSGLASAIAGEMGLDETTLEGIRLGSGIHDIGKIHLPSEILSKPTRLAPEEFKMIKGHPEQGRIILSGIPFPWPLGDIVYQHHERMDGSGYPQGLKGDAICLEARVVAVADVMEAIASHRPYRPALGIDTALEEIKAHRGDWFDPKIVDACLRLFQDKGFTLDQPVGSR